MKSQKKLAQRMLAGPVLLQRPGASGEMLPTDTGSRPLPAGEPIVSATGNHHPSVPLWAIC